MKAWRIAPAPRRVFDGTGAGLVGGRWNPVGAPVIYAASSYALALLEVLVHAQIGAAPPSSRYVEIDIPDDVGRELLDPGDLPGWAHSDCAASQAFGREWVEAARSAVLLVPSVVSPSDLNIVINPAHPDADRITSSAERPLAWEPRLAQLIEGVPQAR